MAATTIKIHTATLILVSCSWLCVSAVSQIEAPPLPAQSPTQPTAPASADKPIPNVVAMMRDVETN